FTRSTAPSNGMDAQRSAGGPLSSPAAAQRCAKGAGLDSGLPDAAQSALPSIALLCSAPTADDFAPRPPHPCASASVLNLHQLDGRDPAIKPAQSCCSEMGYRASSSSFIASSELAVIWLGQHTARSIQVRKCARSPSSITPQGIPLGISSVGVGNPNGYIQRV